MILCCGLVASAQSYSCENQNQIDWIGYENIRGPVASLNVERETLVPQGHLIFTNPGKPYLFATYKYDSKGRLAEKNFYRSDGVALPKSVYLYGTRGELVKEQSYSAVTNAPYLESVYTYEDGKLKTVIGREIEKADSFLSKQVFSYDPSRSYFEFVETKSYRSTSERVGFIQDKKCRFAQILAYDRSGTLVGRNVVTFDDYDNPTNVKAVSSDGKDVGATKFEYEYDSQHNWTKQLQSLWNERSGKWVLQEITYRKITYYDKK